ncbi:MAG: aspartate carbamoyltransferase [Eubacteriales bacterium]|jgi:aspartate carbamoyltransferase catalytic subunit|nr:aspartate carbamoyltransferase [Eubacteriales bacterium]
MNFRHLIDYNDISGEDWAMLIDLANDIKKSPNRYTSECKTKVMATLFYEPSTRTQLSFQTAMLRLGGQVIGFSDPKNSSIAKGESLRDTIKIVSGYADITVIRNPIEGAAYAASLYSTVPVINAGDGSHLHPTQTMTDMYTIVREKGRYENLTIGFCGDLANGRTVHSLAKAFSYYKNNTLYFISTEALRLPQYIINLLSDSGNKIYIVDSLEEHIAAFDILYMTRIQRERFGSVEEYEAQSGIYILNSEKLKQAKDDLLIMHPLPKTDEISFEVDDDPRSKYFEQAENGLYIRMALILLLCENYGYKITPPVYPMPQRRFCSNARCISNHERYLPEKIKRSGSGSLCEYCENTVLN